MKKRKLVITFMTTFLINCLLVCNAFSLPIYVDARAAIVMDKNSQTILFEKDSDMIIPMASTTKIMTTLVCLEYGDLDKKIEISKGAANVRGSQVGYKEGEKITIRELLCGLMMKSGNDAAIALAEGVSGSVDEFCELMNEYARRIGALNSNFESPHGLDSQNHYTTAYDLALITAYAKKNQTFNEIVSAKDIDAQKYNFSRSYHNINKILYTIPNSNGVKTGYTGNAGKCLVTSIIDDNGNEIIIVVLNCYNRWNETKKLYDYIKENYSYEKILEKGQILYTYENNASIIGELYLDKDIILPIKNDESYTVKTEIPEIKLENERSEIDYLGQVNIWSSENKIYSYPLKYRSKSLKNKNKILDILEKINKS
ncbi:D-alanyl-D-alanine carboxypeptidase family protein [Clostridium sp. DL1XJH146]